MNIGKMALCLIEDQLRITKTSALESIFTLSYVIIGSLIIFPLVSKLPLLGWDWFYFFNANNPTINIFSTVSSYPAFHKIHYSITNMDGLADIFWVIKFNNDYDCINSNVEKWWEIHSDYISLNYSPFMVSYVGRSPRGISAVGNNHRNCSININEAEYFSFWIT
jgi:hypothetical protein